MDASTRTAGSTPRTRRTSAHGPSALEGLRIALVHDWLTGMRGGEKCLEVLCRAFPDATLHTLIHREGRLSPAIEAMSIRTSPLQRLPGIFRHYRKLLPVMPLAASRLDVGDVDLVVSLSHCVAKSVSVPAGVPHVCYCFTPMRYVWDGREAYLASFAGKPVRKALASFLLDRLRRWDRSSAARVTHFVSISETIRDRIARCYGRESRVIQPPVDTDFYRPAAEPIARTDGYLCVSALVPYKRIDQAIEACTRSGRPLTIVGEGPERARLERMAGPGVRFLGWQPDEVIREFYQTSRALIFPGEEDFGIVPMEALACGCPVIALAKGGVAETVDDRVGRVYPEPTTESLQAALDTWEAGGLPHDADEARRRADGFSLSQFRNRLLDLLAEVAGQRRHPSAVPTPHHAAARPKVSSEVSRRSGRRAGRGDTGNTAG
jgi:glycosyltransferase involved in cell wall biosynthesis